MSSRPPDWPLIDEIVRRVQAAPGGGMHRADLGRSLGLPAYSRCVREALFVAYAQRKIDFCGQYVVRPPR